MSRQPRRPRSSVYLNVMHKAATKIGFEPFVREVESAQNDYERRRQVRQARRNMRG